MSSVGSATASPGRRLGLRGIAEATPSSRDRYVDFLRAVSICVVVLGHWLIAAIYWKGGRISGENALHVVPGLWLATWILQVMPVFFFVGGFSNLVTLDTTQRRGGSYTEFIHGRVARLMRPTAVFLAIWIPLSIAADLFSPLDDKVLNGATTLLTRPLWFIGIYLIMIAFAPWMIRLHRRFGASVIATMILGAVAVDLVAVGYDVPFAGYLNFAFVWLFVHQLGFFYADGTLQNFKKAAFWGMALGGLALLVLLTVWGPYSSSMVGLQNERSNTNPPTVTIIALTVWQIGLVMLLKDGLSRWLAKVRVWMGVIWISSVIMTMFLWHQTAMLITVGAFYPLGFPQPKAGTAAWWAVRPLWIATLLVVLAVLLLTFGRFEHGPRSERGPMSENAAADRSWQRTVVAVAGVTYVLMGILGFAVAGMDGFAARQGAMLVFFEVNPLQNVVHLLIGTYLLNAAKAGSRAYRKASLVGALLFAMLAGDRWIAEGNFNVIASNNASGVLHVLSALALLSTIALKSESTTSTSTGR